jgi:tetratricopeptide (TPR) repeat protein
MDSFCRTLVRRVVFPRDAFLLVFVTFAAIALCAQNEPPKPILIPKPLEKAAEAAPDYSQQAFVVEKMRTAYRFESDGTGKREFSARIKVQSEAGVEQWGQLVIGYSSANERVEIPYVRVLKTDGSTVTATAEAVQDLSIPLEKEAPVYTDYRQKHVTVPGLRPGEVLEYDVVTTIHTALAPNQFWMEHSFTKAGIVFDEQLEVDVPSSRVPKVKTQPGSDPKIADANGRRVYTWSSSHREDEDKEKDKGKDKDKDKDKKKKTEPEPPSVQMTTFASWEELGRWYAGLEKDRRLPTPEIRAKAAELTAGKTADLDKIEALYDYVATNFRYISLSFGVGRFQPHAAAEVLHNQYGDCKDKHTLLASLLEASGYHASSVLINSGRKLDPDVPSPSQFDHVFSLVPLGKDEVWMDTTTEVAPFRLLSYTLRKKQALIVPPDGVPHLEETPADPAMPNRQIQEIDGKLNEFGKLDAHIKMSVRGDAELYLRIWFRRVPNAKWPEFVKQMNGMVGLTGEVTNLKVGDPAATREAFQFQYDIAASNYLDWTKKKTEMILPLSLISIPDADEDNSSADAEPIEIGGPMDYQYTARLEFPAKYTERAPLPFTMKRDYGQYDASYKVEGTVFTADRKLVINTRDLPAVRTSDYLAFRHAVTTDTGQRVAVDSTAAGDPTAPADLKGDDLNDAANAALARGNFAVAIELLKKVLADDPKHKTARMNLGRAYMALRQTDKAIEVFKMEAEMNPYEEYAYTSLGWAYSADRKYDEAAIAYNKALEINPLSEYGHAALGAMYAEAHQYEKAVPELEKAVSIKDDNPGLEISLGNAYLNIGQDEKALAAFDRAIELSATPEVWNDIAYQLSLRKAHLDRAQQYSESAVTAVSAALRNATLDQLNNRDLAAVSSLAANWDTLGWVYFAKGDYAKAEKYVSAAWIVEQNGEVGDHMGQIYEKLGRKDDAIRAYGMAMSALRPVPETRARLAALAGGDAKVAVMTDKYRGDLQDVSTIKLGKVAKETGSAEFFVMLTPGKTGASAEGVKFVSGDEKLKVFSEALKSAAYNLTFPDDTPTKILRRGVLSCSASTGDCRFVLMLPADVHSVD